MRTQEINFAKKAMMLDGQAERAEVRRARALERGNQREADGAQKTIDEARETAKWLRAKIASK